MLCTKCKNLDLDDLDDDSRSIGGKIEFHHDFQSLKTSAESGCCFCTVVHEAFLASPDADILQELCDQVVWLGIPTRARDWLFTKEQGNSELFAWIGHLKRWRDERESVVVRFSLCLPRSETETITGCLDVRNTGSYRITGRPVAQHADSSAVIKLAQAWLRSCRTNHSACQHVGGDFVPTRTINVGSENPPREPRLEIHASCSGSVPKRNIEWAALSHCWGGVSPLKTTTGTLEDRKCEIPLSSMPRTFRDAVTVARRLHIQHLWIDSLCILQDSVEDWNRECSFMADVYRGSIVNIAADASRNADDGFLKHRHPKSVLAALPFRSRKHKFSGIMLVCPAIDNWSTTLSAEKSPLSSRGWVLQEVLLSRRTLHFAAQQMLWECPTCIISESDMKPVTERFPGEENHSEAWDWHFSKRFCTPYWQKRSKKPPETNTWYNMWYMLLTDYSKRRLTNSSDIFPALSGLQTVFAAFTQDQLLAGPFSNDLERGLLWEVDLFQINHRATPFRAPTWSWASVEGPVSWPFDINSEFIPGYKIQLVDHGTVSKAQKSEDHLGADTHGEVGEGTYIKLLGRWRSTGSWDEITIPTDSNSTHWYLYDHHGMTHATCSFDVGANTDHIHPHFQKGDWGLLQIATWDIYSHVDTTRVLYALILRSVPGVDELYERIGIAHIYTDDIATDAEILDWEVKTLKIV